MLTTILILAPLLLLLFAAPALLLSWLFWKAEEQARAKVFDSSIDHVED